MDYNDVTLRDESGGNLPQELLDRLSAAARVIAKNLRAAGNTQESMKESVVLLFLRPSRKAPSSATVVVPKADLRQYLKALAREFASEDDPPEMPRESLIQRCISPTPNNAVRVLWMAVGYNGTLQVHLDQPAEAGTGSKLRLHDRVPLLQPDAELLAAKNKLRDTVLSAEAFMDERPNRLAHEVFEKVKDLPPEQALRVLMDADLALSEEMKELREKRAELGEAREDMLKALIEYLPQFREQWKSVEARARKVVIPPDATSATNLEALLMAASYVFDKITVDTKLSKEEVAFLIGHFSANDVPVKKLLVRMEQCFRGKAFSGTLQDFGIDWMRQGFPKLEVGQKLAASLALTDVPDDIEVVAPWKAWSLIVPPGLFGPASVGEGDFARLWCRGTEVLFVVMSKGGITGPMTEEIINKMWAPEMNGLSKTIGSTRLTWLALNSLVKGACLALSNPDDYKRESLKDRHNKELKKQRDGEPDFAVSRFMLSAPVQIDLRQTLLDELAGKKRSTGGGSPTVQFFVRGHWRNQAHGPGRALRKTIRIEGFWKGPEEGRVLLRNYKVKEDENAKTPEGGAEDTQANPPSGG